MILSTSCLFGICITTMTSPLGTFKELNGQSHKSRPDTYVTPMSLHFLIALSFALSPN